VTGELIPLWIKVLYTLFLCVLVPVYWVHWGPRNFLWFSDIALLATGVALWLVLSGRHVLGLSGYMFDARRPLFLRGLSLFHVVLPFLLLWMVHRLGYDRRAWAFQTVVALVVLPVTYAVTEPADNVNWVYGPGSKPQTWMTPRIYLGLVMLVFPIVIYLPTHLLLSALFGER
jgi:hypothetical protein